ncbi:MAG: PGPGW domain-containing protein [Phycisphaerales bacterium]
MLEWLQQHPGLIVSGGLCLVLLVAAALATPSAVARLPNDFFTRDRSPSLWLNIGGWVLIAAGVAMLILPGPGAVVLLAGVMFADFPGKRRLLRWFLAHDSIFNQLNRIRAKRGKPALQRP